MQIGRHFHLTHSTRPSSRRQNQVKDLEGRTQHILFTVMWRQTYGK